MKRILSAIICVLFTVSCAACAGNNIQKEESSMENSEESVVQGAESSVEPSEEPIAEPSEEKSEPVVERTWPTVSGTFMQPGSFTAFTEKNWETHFKNLKEVGIDIFIIQWTAETPYGKIKSIYYPSALAENNKASGFTESPDLLPTVLSVAERMGMKVFVGLNLSDEWWSFAVTNSEWNKTVSSLGVEMAKEIHALYKEKYPNALHGWYFAYEMFNGMMGYEKAAGDFLNMYLGPLTELDETMPMMLSPYVRSVGGTAEKAGEEWTKVFQTADFREGDIFCCQDAVGAGHITIDQLDGYFKNLKKAVDTEEGLLFWANSENFIQHPSFSSAPVKRFIKQMEIAKPYVSGYVTFAYSHYYAKDFNGKVGYHYAYKHYYETGDASADIVTPALSYEKTDSGVRVKATAQNVGAGIVSITFSAEGKDKYVYEIPATRLTKEQFTASYNISKREGVDKLTVKVTVCDYYGNETAETIEVEF